MTLQSKGDKKLMEGSTKFVGGMLVTEWDLERGSHKNMTILNNPPCILCLQQFTH